MPAIITTIISLISANWPIILGSMAVPYALKALISTGILEKLRLSILATAAPFGDFISALGTSNKVVKYVYVPLEVFIFDTICQYAEELRRGALRDNPDMQARQEGTKADLETPSELTKRLDGYDEQMAKAKAMAEKMAEAIKENAERALKG